MLYKADGTPLLQPGRTAIMGILNTTPDSFSDGGLFVSVEKAASHARSMVVDGAEIIDIGGESTRPGASSVSIQEELDRVIPVIEAISNTTDVLISIDTSKPMVMNEAINAGAGLINDVRALTEAGAVQAVAELGVPVCLMHMQGQPKTMQDKPVYDDVTAVVREFLKQRVASCVDAGIDKSKLILDPGFGFGKTEGQNYTLLNKLEQIRIDGLPILAGLSRKSVIEKTLGLSVDERASASVALALLAVRNGANIVRVHDVKETSDAIRITAAVEKLRVRMV